jgi:hypothetical protein
MRFFWDVTPCSRVQVDRQAASKSLFATCFLGLLCKPEIEGNTFLRNIRELLPNLIASHPKQQFHLSFSLFSLVFKK